MRIEYTEYGKLMMEQMKKQPKRKAKKVNPAEKSSQTSNKEKRK